MLSKCLDSNFAERYFQEAYFPEISAHISLGYNTSA